MALLAALLLAVFLPPGATAPAYGRPPTPLITDIPLTGSAVVSQAALTWNGSTEEIYLYVSDLERDPESTGSSAIFVPVPAQAHPQNPDSQNSHPTYAQIVDNDLWQDLSYLFHPQILQFNAAEHPNAWFHPAHADESGAPRSGFGMEESQVFSHTEPDALTQWLTEHQAEPSPGQSRILTSYLAAGWSVAVLMVPPGQAVTWKISFDTPELIFPLRAINPAITTSTGELPLAVAATHRMERNDAGAKDHPATTVIEAQLTEESHELRPGSFASEFMKTAVARQDVITAMVLPRIPWLGQETLPDLSFAPVDGSAAQAGESPESGAAPSTQGRTSGAGLAAWVVISVAVIIAGLRISTQLQRRRRAS